MDGALDVYAVGGTAVAVRSVALVVLLLRRVERVTLLRRGTVRLPSPARCGPSTPVACARAESFFCQIDT